jgi:hypothetical protein
VVVAVAGAKTTQREADRAVVVVVPKVGLIPQRELQNPDHRIQVVVAVAAPTSLAKRFLGEAVAPASSS